MTADERGQASFLTADEVMARYRYTNRQSFWQFVHANAVPYIRLSARKVPLRPERASGLGAPPGGRQTNMKPVTVASITPHGESAKIPAAASAPKLSYGRLEVCELLGIGPVTLWRLEKLGRIRSVPGVGVKIYPRAEIERFLKLP